jgi:hypothetical protein
MQIKIRQRRASVLVVSLIILGVILVSALTFSLATLQQRKASIGSSHSDQAYQNAESGVEAAMSAVLNTSGTVGNLASTLGVTCDDNGGHSPATFNLNSSKYYKIQLLDNKGSYLYCADQLSDATEIKSVGTDVANQDTRAIEAAVAFGSQKLCAVFSTGIFFNSMTVNTDWAIINCQNWANDMCGNSQANIANCKYEVGCYESVSGSNDPTSWGSSASTSSSSAGTPSPNCGW